MQALGHKCYFQIKNTNCVGRYFYSTEKADFVHRAYH